MYSHLVRHRIFLYFFRNLERLGNTEGLIKEQNYLKMAMKAEKLQKEMEALSYVF